MITAALLFLLPQATYVQPGFAAFDPVQAFRSVGVFGSFGKGTEVQTRDSVGLLSFTLREDAPENTMVWANLDNGKDHVIGRAVFPGPITEKHFDFMDWTTGCLHFKAGGAATEIYYSRTFPAALYMTEARQWSWASSADRVAYRSVDGKIGVLKGDGALPSLGAPWVLVWHASAGEVVPVLVRFEKKPASLVMQGGSLNADFSSGAGSIVAMPLMGARRAKNWSDSVPGEAMGQVEFWSRAVASFPIGTDESFAINDETRRVRITDRYRYHRMDDAWHAKPLILAPVPPVIGVAQANGYAMHWVDRGVRESPLATLLGAYAYREGDEVSYELPVPSARDNAQVPVFVKGDPIRQAHIDEANHLALTTTIKPDDTQDGGLNLQLKEFSQAFPLLNGATQAAVLPALKAAFHASYLPENLQTVTEPVTGQKYVMCSKIWCAGEPYDREWYTGRQLDFTSEFASTVSGNAADDHWPAIQGLYAYYRIYNDWAWAGTLSSVFSYALTGDGMNFSLEGMLGTARLARRHGDQELWRDASYRAAKEAACTYASWFLPDWVKKIDYATVTDTSYDYAAKKGRYQVKRMDPKEVETGFGLDIFDNYTGIKVLRNGMFWHASSSFYWNNPSLDRLYAETLYPKVYRWEFETMPRLYPHWTDRNFTEVYENHPYGSNMVINHLDARTVLFGQSPTELEALTTKLQPDIAFLYRLRAQTDMAQSGAPQLWLPTGQADIRNVVWDAAAKTLSADIGALSSGPATLDWTWRGVGGVSSHAAPGPKPEAVEVDGELKSYGLVTGGFYRVATELSAGRTTRLRIKF